MQLGPPNLISLLNTIECGVGLKRADYLRELYIYSLTIIGVITWPESAILEFVEGIVCYSIEFLILIL